MPPDPDPPDKFANNRFHLLGDYMENTSKRQKPNDYPDLPTPRLDKNSNPKYVVISSTDPKKQLSDISPFVLKKNIESISTEINSISQLRDGSLLILASSPRVADKFLKTKCLGFYGVSCKLHDSLNSVKGVIYAPCLNKVPEEEIVKELKSQGVTDVYKFTRINGDGKTRSPTGKIVLTFNLFRLPRVIDIAWYKCKIDFYLPNPMQCKNCQRLGHTTKRCNGTPTCPQCSLPPHVEKECSRTLCTNCSGEHSSTDKECPRYIQMKEILKIKTENYCSIGEARRKYQAIHPSSNNHKPNTYASVISNTTTKNKEPVNQKSSKKSQQNISATKHIDIQSSSRPNTSTTINLSDKPTTSKIAYSSITPTKTTDILVTKNNNEKENSTKTTNTNYSSQTKTNLLISPISNLTQQLISSNSYFIPMDSQDELSSS